MFFNFGWQDMARILVQVTIYCNIYENAGPSQDDQAHQPYK